MEQWESGPRPLLRRLAQRLGIDSDYTDQTGRERRQTSDATCILLLRAMGYEAGTEADAADALATMDRAARDELLPPTRVMREQVQDQATARLQLPVAATGRIGWLLTLETEDGGTASATGEVDVHEGNRFADAPPPLIELPLPAALEPGYHMLTVAIHWDGGETSAVQRLIVVPDACWLPADVADWHGFGLTANLYTVREEHDWGIGNTTSLRKLLEWGAELGADFVGVNPLHALFDRGSEISPYSPVSRLYRSPHYLDLAAIPELDHAPVARALIQDPSFVSALAELRASPVVEYERIVALERGVLEELHAVFVARHRGSDTARGFAYAAYLDAEGDALVDFATFMALDEVQTAARGQPDWFRRWPEGLRWSGDRDVPAFRSSNAELVDFHCWLQFELDRQLAEAAEAGRAAGMRLGLYQDLAIGSSGGGSDAWAYPELLLQGVSIGAPPDMLGPDGQDWGLPPIDPRRLAADGYSYWIQLLRGAFRHAGALRLDHVLGLFRQFWIPDGASARDGAYVRFPSEELLGILALESHRNQALVVGEDLGTVPPEVPPALARWHILSSKVLYFERDWHGRFRSAASYDRHALATANTHDLAPLAGYLSGEDLRLRAAVTDMPSTELATQLETRRATVRQLVEQLVAEGVLSGDVAVADSLETPAGKHFSMAMRRAVHSFLRSTPAMLVGIALDDLAGETQPVNMPGLNAAQFSSWTRRMQRTLSALEADPTVYSVLGSARARELRS